MAEERAIDQLTPKQKRMVVLFTSEGKKDTYLNRFASYSACFSTKSNRQSIQANAYRLFKKASIQAAIKEMMPPLAYDHFFVSNEYMEHYESAKRDDDRKDCLDILKEMARHTGMLDKKRDVAEDSVDKKDYKAMTDAINSNFLLRKQEMEKMKDGS